MALERRPFLMGAAAAVLMAHPLTAKVRGMPRTARAAEPSSPLVALLEAYRQRQNIPGLAAAVVVDGRVAYCGGLGTCEAGTDRAVTDRTPFLIYSVSKVVTAGLVLQLAEDRRLDLEDPVRLHLPELKVDARRLSQEPVIRVRHLLAHASGWGRERVGLPVRIVKDGTLAGTSLEEALAGEPLNYLPGTGHSYSNLNYALLARILERVTGRPYAQVLRDRFLAPLGMEDSGSGLGRERVDRAASGHLARFSLMDWMLRYFYPSGFRRKLVARTSGFREQVLAPFELALPGYGDGVASARDLATFLRFHLDAADPAFECVLPWRRRQEMRDPGTGPYGWGTGLATGGRDFHHVGGGPGFKAHVFILPELRFGMAVLTNRFVSPSLEPLQVLDAALRHAARGLETAFRS